MKTYGGMKVQTHVFFTLALVGSERPATRLGHFTPGERAPGTHWTGGWVGPRAVWTTWRSENFCPHQDSNSDPLVVLPIASCYTDCAIAALQILVNERTE
jgi:hypothetical protein